MLLNSHTMLGTQHYTVRQCKQRNSPEVVYHYSILRTMLGTRYTALRVLLQLCTILAPLDPWHHDLCEWMMKSGDVPVLLYLVGYNFPSCNSEGIWFRLSPARFYSLETHEAQRFSMLELCPSSTVKNSTHYLTGRQLCTKYINSSTPGASIKFVFSSVRTQERKSPPRMAHQVENISFFVVLGWGLNATQRNNYH